MVIEERLFLVVPCYNEAMRLDRAAFLHALQTMPWLDLCFVDDGSTDKTGDMLRALKADQPDRVTIVSLPRNVGKAEAVRQGLLVALDTTGWCGFWDADLAAPLCELPELRAIGLSSPHVEWVWGIRLRALGRRVERQLSRHYLGRVFATVASATLGLHSYDTQCGAKVFRVSPLLHEVIAEPFVSTWIFDIELLARADALLGRHPETGVDSAVFEQPLRVWRHQRGSKVRGFDFVRAIIDLVRIRADRVHWQHRDRSRLARDAATTP